MPLTQAGAIFGTPAYMSPEQARGLAVDKRADVWAFGCVLFEMLAGRRPFDGQTSTDALAAILARDPDWSFLPATTPPAVHRLLRRCLAKDAGRRLRDIGDARIELDDVSSLDDVEPARANPALRGLRRQYLAAFAAAILIALGAAALGRRLSGPAAGTPPVTRTSIVLPSGQKLFSGDSTYSLALSADGLRLAYVGEQEGRTQLYLRELRSLESRALSGTAGATQPFFSPDAEWVGYFASGALQKVATSGGAPLRICAVPSLTRGASWGRDGRIVFALRGSGLHVVEAAGGEPRRVGDFEEARWPEILPDGRTVLFTTQGGIATVAIAGGTRHVVAKTNDSPLDGPAVLGTGALSQARYLPSGHLVYGQSPGIVRAAPFDLASSSLTGPVASLVESVERARNAGAVYFAVSASGMLVYASTGYRHQLVWVDRAGAVTAISGDREAFRGPRVSPDGTQLAVGANDETRRGDVWVYDLQRGTKRRLTTERHNGWPIWTRDGRSLTFSYGGELGEVPADGSAPPAVLWARRDPNQRYPCSWSLDGRELLFEVDGPGPYGGAGRENSYDVAPDGRRFAMVKDDDASALCELTVVQGWFEELRRRLPPSP